MHLTGLTAALAALTLTLLLPTPLSAHPTTTLFERANSNSTNPRLPPNTRYSEQAFIGTHHSAMLRTQQNGFSLSGSQFHSITVQLEAGVRLLHGQMFLLGNDIRICHSSCALLDGGSLQDFLTEVSSFLNRFQGEVVTLMWTNPDGSSPLGLIDKFYQKAGLDKISYIPPHKEMNIKDWPTIAEMVLAERRLVTFMDSAVDQKQVKYIMPLWGFVRETPAAVVTDKDTFTCGTGSDQSPPGEKLAMLNHMLYDDKYHSAQRFPNVQRVGFTNSATGEPGALLNHLDTCAASWDRKPNFAVVDFFDRGNVFLAQDIINGLVPHPPGTKPITNKAGASNKTAKTKTPFITLAELEKERQREAEKKVFQQQVEDGRKKAGINGEQVKSGQGLAVFTYTRTGPPTLEETDGVVNAGAKDPNGAGRGGVQWRMMVVGMGVGLMGVWVGW